MIENLLELEQLYRSFEGAARTLEGTLGTPLCQESCGKCCQTVFAHRVEGIFAISTSIGDGTLDQVSDCAESWLLDRHACAPTYEGPHLGPLSKIGPELYRLSVSPCPFLMEDKGCLIYRGRPMVCRAFGVTYTPGPRKDFCPRRRGSGEAEDVLGWVDTPELEHNVKRYFNSLPADLKMVGLIPSIIFKQLHPDKWKAYIADNRIASAKLVGLPDDYPAMLWQHQQSKEHGLVTVG